jgi:hypothetical protein
MDDARIHQACRHAFRIGIAVRVIACAGFGQKAISAPSARDPVFPLPPVVRSHD